MDEIQENLNQVHLNNEDAAEIICRNTSAVSKTFDVAVGHIEDIIIGKKHGIDNIYLNDVLYIFR